LLNLNYRDILEPEVVGFVDSQKEGKYVLNYIATDQAGNVATQRQVVLVQKKGTHSFSKREHTNQREEREEHSPLPVTMENQNVSDIVMTDEMILENEYLKELIASDFYE